MTASLIESAAVPPGYHPTATTSASAPVLTAVAPASAESNFIRNMIAVVSLIALPIIFIKKCLGINSAQQKDISPDQAPKVQVTQQGNANRSKKGKRGSWSNSKKQNFFNDLAIAGEPEGQKKKCGSGFYTVTLPLYEHIQLPTTGRFVSGLTLKNGD
jgi:hypothetical protein